MFTGLKATNHFGRPNFDLFLKFLQQRHQEVGRDSNRLIQTMASDLEFQVNDIGVFSCGPANVNKLIRRACTEANRLRNAPSFTHRFETF